MTATFDSLDRRFRTRNRILNQRIAELPSSDLAQIHQQVVVGHNRASPLLRRRWLEKRQPRVRFAFAYKLPYRVKMQAGFHDLL